MSTFINQQKSWRKVLGWLSSTSIIGIFSSRVTRSFSSSVNSKEARYTPLRIEKKKKPNYIKHSSRLLSRVYHWRLRAIFNWVSKVIRDYIGFALLRSVIGPSSQQIRCKTKTNHDLVARFFPHFKQFGCFHFEFSIAPKGILWFNFGFGFTTINRKVSTLAIKQSLSRKSKNVWDYKRFKTFVPVSHDQTKRRHKTSKKRNEGSNETNSDITKRR